MTEIDDASTDWPLAYRAAVVAGTGVVWERRTGEPDFDRDAWLLLRSAEPGDELWWYTGSEAAFERRCGDAGWAIVRGDRVVAATMVIIA